MRTIKSILGVLVVFLGLYWAAVQTQAVKWITDASGRAWKQTPPDILLFTFISGVVAGAALAVAAIALASFLGASRAWKVAGNRYREAPALLDRGRRINASSRTQRRAWQRDFYSWRNTTFKALNRISPSLAPRFQVLRIQVSDHALKKEKANVALNGGRADDDHAMDLICLDHHISRLETFLDSRGEWIRG